MFRIRLSPGVSSEDAWSLLESKGIEVLFGEEENGIEELVVRSRLSSEKILSQFSFVHSCHPEVLAEVDWEKEWEKHALHFSDGKVQLDLKPYGVDHTLLLVPGAGFGELSHPTTHLVLELMKGRISGNTVVDIGSGSGILALAAKALGAKEVIGIDIDREANLHAAQNALLNGFEISFFHPDEMPVLVGDEPIVVLMNMITSEQQEAWKAFCSNRRTTGIALTSGVLFEQEESYRKLLKSWGWAVQQVIQKEGWLGVVSSMRGKR